VLSGRSKPGLFQKRLEGNIKLSKMKKCKRVGAGLGADVTAKGGGRRLGKSEKNQTISAGSLSAVGKPWSVGFGVRTGGDAERPFGAGVRLTLNAVDQIAVAGGGLTPVYSSRRQSDGGAWWVGFTNGVRVRKRGSNESTGAREGRC